MRTPIRFPSSRSALVLGGLSALMLAQSVQAVQVIVDVYDGIDPAALAKKYGIAPDNVFTEVANGFSADITSRQITALEADNNVEQVTADRVAARIDLGKFRILHGGRFQSGAAPYTPPAQPPQHISSEILRIKGNLSKTASIDGRGPPLDVDIAVLDTGVDPYHPDLNVAGGFDCVRGPKAERGWGDPSGHGTFVAGIAAARDNGVGIVGVAPGARIWSVRVAGTDGSVELSAYLCGLEYVAHNRQIEVVNMSFEFPEYDGKIEDCIYPRRHARVKFGARPQIDKYHEHICRLVAKGVTLVAAAGNEAVDAYQSTPAAYKEVIAVSAMVDFDGVPGALSAPPPECYPTDVDDTFAVFSNYGDIVDISAPGVCNESTLPGGIYGIGDGTSYATPMVAGAAALLYVKRPGISPEQVRAIIRNRAQFGTITGDPDGIEEGVLDVSSF